MASSVVVGAAVVGTVVVARVVTTVVVASCVVGAFKTYSSNQISSIIEEYN